MMVLFICRANVGRSQMAMTFFNDFSKRHRAISAGTDVGKHEGEPLHPFVIEAMQEAGYDLSKNRRRQLTREIVGEANKVVVITSPADLPYYVDKSRTIFWDVEDVQDHGLGFYEKMREKIRHLVTELAEELDQKP